jgi:hypothetical protein
VLEDSDANVYDCGQMGTKAEFQDYFRPRKQRQALAAYADFAAKSKWSVLHKMDLYDDSRGAFSSGVGEEERFKSFERIYTALNRYWQIFRPYGAKRCWRARQIFDLLQQEFGEFSQSSGICLLNFGDNRRQAVVRRMKGLKGMKPTCGYPVMAVSKFLHFYNPGLFPIYDGAVVDKRVFRAFGSDYEEFCTDSGLDSRASGAEFLGNYMNWGNRLLSSAGPRFMEIFVEWLQENESAAHDVARLSDLHAMAFEFTAIGATVDAGY